jgi:hypothetical protein
VTWFRLDAPGSPKQKAGREKTLEYQSSAHACLLARQIPPGSNCIQSRQATKRVDVMPKDSYGEA